MSNLKYQALIFFILCVGSLIVVRDPINSQESKRTDFERLPLIDYVAAEPTDPLERAKWASRAKRHNIKYAPRIDQLTDSTFLISDWDVDLPALPVERSAAVVIGRVTKAQSQLSENKTGIYSEFTVHLAAILKNDSKTPLDVNNPVELVRVGGRVRLPSGKIIVSGVVKQDMPQMGSKYLLFLTHHSLHGGEDEDFYILTGYELKEGKAFPLDKVSASHPINKYNGVSETQLFTDLSSALAKLSPSNN